MLDNLRPIANQHSISKAVATIYIPQTFLKPEDIFEKAKSIERFNLYQKKTLTRGKTFNFKNNSLNLEREEIKGFIFENFDERGAIRNIFRLDNIHENQSSLATETRMYKDWDSFKHNIDQDLSAFSKLNDFYIGALGLNYRDEFLWINPNSNIDVDTIFNIDSELLNKKFRLSKNGTLLLISQGKIDESTNYEEKTEISFNNDIKRIVIDHVYAIKFNDIQSFSKLNDQNNFSDLFNLAHTENKEILKDVLTKECQNLIKLK